MKIRILLFLVLLFSFVGCSRQDTEQSSSAGRSSYTTAQVMKDAETWSANNPGRKVAVAEATGSMLRVFDSNCIVLLEKIGPTDVITIGDILVYKNKILNKNITHRLVGFTSDGKLILKGDNLPNEDPDPVDRSEIQYRVVGVLYTNGK